MLAIALALFVNASPPDGSETAARLREGVVRAAATTVGPPAAARERVGVTAGIAAGAAAARERAGIAAALRSERARPLPRAVWQALEEDGSAVVAGRAEPLFGVYARNAYEGVPSFYSVDLFLHLARLRFDELAGIAERSVAVPELTAFAASGLERALAAFPREGVVEPRLRRLALYHAVPLALLRPALRVDPRLADDVAPVAAAIRAGAGSIDSPACPKPMDGARFAPRGRYVGWALAGYSQAAELYSSCAFDLGSPEGLSRGLDLVRAVDSATRSHLARVVELRESLSGAREGTGLAELSALLPPGVPEWPEAMPADLLSSLASGLRLRSLDAPAQGLARIEEWSLLGAAPLPDSEALSRAAGTRTDGLPSSLDLIAALRSEGGGSDAGRPEGAPQPARSEGELDGGPRLRSGRTESADIPGVTGASGATGMTGVPGVTGATGVAGVTGAAGAVGTAGVTGAPGMTGSKLATGAAGTTGASEPADHGDAQLRPAVGLYARWLDVLRCALAPAGEAVPAFARTDAWRARQVVAAAASWAELRHDTLSTPRPPVIWPEEGVPRELASARAGAYLDPRPDLYRSLGAILRDLGSLGGGDASRDEAEKLGSVLTFADEVSQAELAGAPLPAASEARLRQLAGELERLTRGHGDELPPAPLVVAAFDGQGPDGPRTLYAGVGHPDELWVVVPRQGRFVLARGAVASFYERVGQGGARLTDEAWERELKPPSAVERPAWARPTAPGSPGSRR